MTARGPPGSGAFLGEWPVVLDKVGGWSLGLLLGYHFLEEMSGVQSRCEVWCTDLVFRMWCTGLSMQGWVGGAGVQDWAGLQGWAGVQGGCAGSVCRAGCAGLGWFTGLGWCTRLVFKACRPGVPGLCAELGVQDWAGCTGLESRASVQGWCAGLVVCRPAVRSAPPCRATPSPSSPSTLGLEPADLRPGTGGHVTHTPKYN